MSDGTPYQSAIDAGYLVLRSRVIGRTSYAQSRVTGRGTLYISGLLDKHGVKRVRSWDHDIDAEDRRLSRASEEHRPANLLPH